MKIKDRVKAPTPKFFKVLRNIGLVLAAVGGTILAAPVALPVVLTTVGGYLAVAGGVVSAVSQLTTATAEEVTPYTIEPSEVQEGLRQAQPDITVDEQGNKGKGKTLSPRKRSGLKGGPQKVEPDNATDDNG